MERCLARQEGAIDKAVTDTACISLASSGDGDTSQKENIARNSPSCFGYLLLSVAYLGCVNTWLHFHHVLSFRTASI